MSDDPEPPGHRRLSTDELRARKPARAEFATRPRTPIALVLDGVTGPYNQGAVFRLADGFMLEHLHLCQSSLQPWNRRFKKAARGTTEWVPHTTGEATVDVVRRYRDRGYKVVVAELAEGSIPAWQARLEAPMVLVLGAELRGVSDAVLALADVVIEFPCLGMANSLNISMCAAMLVHAAFGQAHRAQSDKSP